MKHLNFINTDLFWYFVIRLNQVAIQSFILQIERSLRFIRIQQFPSFFCFLLLLIELLGYLWTLILIGVHGFEPWFILSTIWQSKHLPTIPCTQLTQVKTIAT